MIKYDPEIRNLEVIALVEIANQLERIADKMEMIVK